MPEKIEGIMITPPIIKSSDKYNNKDRNRSNNEKPDGQDTTCHD
jgi:hypothetical protein